MIKKSVKDPINNNYNKMTEGSIFNETQLDIFSPVKDDYPLNVNLKKPYWLQYLIIGMSIINLSIVAFTVVFQLSNPKSM